MDKVPEKSIDLDRFVPYLTTLYGDVKSVDVVLYEQDQIAYSTKATDLVPLFPFSRYLFDRSGRLIEELKLNQENSIVSKKIYKYDDSGKKIECFESDKKWVLSKTNRFSYDDFGNLLLVECLYEHKTPDTNSSLNTKDIIERNEYNSEGLKLTTYHYFWGDTISSITKFHYDSLGRNVLRQEHDTQNQILYTQKFEFDTNNRVIQASEYAGIDSLEVRREMGYDHRGNKTAVSLYGGDDELFRYIEYTYDKLGNELTGAMYGVEGEEYWIENRVKNVYEYDSRYNWVLKEEYSSGDPTVKILRHFDYYN